jgi:transposase
LTRGEEQEREQPLKTPPERRLRDRGQAVLRAARGRARHLSAQDLGVQRTTRRWGVQSYRGRGLQGLQLQGAPGHPRRIPAEVAPPSVEGVKGGPARGGLQRAHGPSAAVAAYLSTQPGIEVSEPAMRDCGHRQQIPPSRPPSRYWRGNPQRQAQAQRELTELKEKPRRGPVSC